MLVQHMFRWLFNRRSAAIDALVERVCNEQLEREAGASSTEVWRRAASEQRYMRLAAQEGVKIPWNLDEYIDNWFKARGL